MNHPKIIAVDFDGCLVTNRFPDIGEPIPETISALKHEQENGAKVILWTCRRDDQLTAATDWCVQQGIRLDAVNRNLPEIVEAFGGDTVKVFANEYWDDRAVKMPPPMCADAHKYPDGTCAGYQRSNYDDEPCDRCKTCTQNEFYEEEQQ